MLIRKMKIYFFFFIAFILQSVTLLELHAGNTSSIEQSNSDDAKQETINFLMNQFPHELLMEICGYLKNCTYKAIRENGNFATEATNCLVPLSDGKLAVNYRGGFKIFNLNDSTIPPLVCNHPHNSKFSYIICAIQLPDGKLVSGGSTLGVWKINEDGSFTHYRDYADEAWDHMFKWEDFRSIVFSDGIIHVACRLHSWSGRCHEAFSSEEQRIFHYKDLLHKDLHYVVNAKWQNIIDSSDGYVMFKRHVDRNNFAKFRAKGSDQLKCIKFGEYYKDIGITCLAALLDGRLATASIDNNDIRIWNLDDPTQAPEIVEGHTGRVTCLCRLPDGNLISGSRDSTLRVWNSQHFKAHEQVIAMPGKVTCITLLTNDKIAVGLNCGGIYIVQLGSSELEEALNNHKKSNKTLTINVRPRSSQTIEPLSPKHAAQSSAAKSAAGIAIRNSTSATSRIASTGIDTKHSQQLSDAKKTRDTKRALREVKRKEMQLCKAIATSMSENNAESSMQGTAMTEANSPSSYRCAVIHALIENKIPAAARSIIREYL